MIVDGFVKVFEFIRWDGLGVDGLGVVFEHAVVIGVRHSSMSRTMRSSWWIGALSSTTTDRASHKSARPRLGMRYSCTQGRKRSVSMVPLVGSSSS